MDWFNIFFNYLMSQFYIILFSPFCCEIILFFSWFWLSPLFLSTLPMLAIFWLTRQFCQFFWLFTPTLSKSFINWLFPPSFYLYSYISMSFSNFWFGEAVCLLLAFILPVSISITITTVNNNIYNYSCKYKKKQKLLNQILKWKKKKKNKLRRQTNYNWRSRYWNYVC